MKFYVYVVLAGLVLIAGVGAVFIYNNWLESRYDEIIVEKAKKYNLPPALIKAIVLTTDRRENHFGPMGLLPQVFDAYQQAMMTRPYGFACTHQNRPPHKKEIFETKGECPVCGSQYISEYALPETNIEIGAWYLAYLRNEIESRLAAKSLNSLKLALYAYIFDLARLEQQTNNFSSPLMTEKMRGEIAPVLVKWQKYKNR